ncbi:D-2-hydroxyacid dehydrogenase [Oenococcus alcoholitolerans]|uniref:Lactate dehydrogenase n=1 Tax=Oenococcus alcoholitolerans TaxID=931074 RepID=A0ABR4XPY1_9LACO|nr:lactate dehydrogenase [Oenococcus alcoholitolerans]
MKILVYAAFGEEMKYIKKFAAETGHQVDTIPDALTEKNVDAAKGYDAISTQQTSAVPDAVYAKLVSFGIKQITIRQVGYDILNIPLLRKAGLRASNVAAYSPRAIAEYTLTQLLNLLRHNKQYYRAIEKGNWKWSAAIPAAEVHQLTIAVIGAGRIGSAFAEMLHALGARILAVDPVYHAQNEAFLQYTDLKDALAQADVVTFHTPLNDQTIGMADERFFAQIKKGALLLNFARGALVKTPALIQALESGRLAGAALDVLPNENLFMDKIQNPNDLPDDVQKLLSMDNVLLSPHVAFYTNLAIKNMVYIALNDAVALSQGKDIENEIFH